MDLIIQETADIILDYFKKYSPTVKVAKSGSVYIAIAGEIVRISGHKSTKLANHWHVRTDWKKYIRRPQYSADFIQVLVKELKIKLDKRK